MSYEELKNDIEEIIEIATSVPEAFREKCFEILLSHALLSKNPKTIEPQVDSTKTKVPNNLNSDDNSYPSHIKAFMRRQSITIEQMQSLVMIDGDTIHFLKEPSHKEASRGQNEWALLSALKNGLLNNSLKTDPEEVRSLVQDKGFYDAKNFTTNFKKQKYAGYFKEILETQGSAQQLSQDGEKALATLITNLVG